MARVGVSKPTVIAWKKRYAAAGIAGLEDRPKPGRPAQVDEVAVVLATLEPPPETLGVTHWSSRLLADHLSDQGTAISNVWVARIWRKWGLQPWRRETFKFSTDPQLEAKVRDVVGLYLDPPEKAVVLSIDEKVPDPGPGPDRADPADAPGPAGEGDPRLRPARHHHPVRRAGDRDRQGHRRLLPAAPHEEFLRFLKQVAKAYPRVKLHLVVRQLRHPQTPHRQGLAGPEPADHHALHPDLGSWLNMVEIFFGIITRQAIRRGTFTCVKDLIAAIETFIDGWNERCQPFTWTKTADQILEQSHPRSKIIIHATLASRRARPARGGAVRPGRRVQPDDDVTAAGARTASGTTKWHKTGSTLPIPLTRTRRRRWT